MGRVEAGGGSPEGGKGKFAEIFFDFGADGIRPGINVEHFSAIGGIHGARGDGVIRGGIHVIPPKKFCAGEAGFQFAEFLPNFPAMDEMIGLLPELNLGQFAIIPTIGDDAVLRGWRAGEIGGLRGAGDGGKSRNDGGLRAPVQKPADAGRGVAEERFGEANDIKNRCAFHEINLSTELSVVAKLQPRWRHTRASYRMKSRRQLQFPQRVRQKICRLTSDTGLEDFNSNLW